MVARSGIVRRAPQWRLLSTFLDRGEVGERIQNVVRDFDKVDEAAVTATAHFTNDLGLLLRTIIALGILVLIAHMFDDVVCRSGLSRHCRACVCH